jgi:endo-1,4-beta-xylanase
MKRYQATISLMTLIATSGFAMAQGSLKEAFKEHFLVGAALNEAQFTEQHPAETALIKAQFNSITSENVMKWEEIHPEPGRFNFGPADRYVSFGEKHGMFMIGHTLVWHQQTPRWVFEDGKGGPADRETLLARLRNHIHTVVGRYKGRVHGWDVVNEALDEDGNLRQSPWLRIIGEEYLVKAFEFAHEADPGAELYYNDFSLENEPKRNGAVRLVKKLQAAGAHITGLGTQTHARLDWPTARQVDETLTAFGKLGLKIMVTELDVDVLPSRNHNQSAEVSLHIAGDSSSNPYTNGLPADVQRALANQYAELFAVYLRHSRTLSRVTFWGVTDETSWLNNWPIRGRTSYPLLFDRQGNPKEAFNTVMHTAAGKPQRTERAETSHDRTVR